jgi:hypothetical protein
MNKVPGASEDAVIRLVERLHAVRIEHESQPPGRRRAALARELELQLAMVPAAERHAVLERALGALRPATGRPAEDDRGAGAKLHAEVALVRSEREALVKERDAIRTTRDALLRENAKLRGELEAKAALPTAPAGASGSVEAFRAGLKEAISGKRVDPNKLGLSATEVRLFRLTHVLVHFIQELERGRIAFLNEVEGGRKSGMGTVIIKEAQGQVRKQLLAVLNEEEGSIRKLQKTIGAQKNFIFGVPDSFMGAIPTAVAGLLAQLDPDPILARSKKILTDYERAWADFVRTRSDLANLTPDELWQTYFKEGFQAKLKDWTHTEG